MDKLDQIYKLQRQLLELFGHNFDNLESDQKVIYIKDTILSMTDELHEVLNLFPWKNWKNYSGEHHNLNLPLIKEEVVDALHFFINLCLMIGISSNELFDEFIKKNNKNIERIKNGINNRYPK
ncbi:MAG TPA: dUTPase [Chitinophagales bacterium]|nr:dUTPase [Chitinophagales bacterium]HMW93508.1 dUTPase [Chitinophagales bacterium]HMZ92994.1 dUTPase [Chitinophagales bacterium]HNG25943.1 dUTPase [Chitinophagales bacterium]